MCMASVLSWCAHWRWDKTNPTCRFPVPANNKSAGASLEIDIFDKISIMRRILLLFAAVIFMASTPETRAQVNVRDSAMFIPMLYANYTFQIPGADMKDRFGSNSNIGGGFQVKMRGGWILGADFNYIFGNNVKGSDTLLKSISTSDGYIINSNGEFTDVYFYERGFYTSLRFGKLFPIWSPNPNSGPLITASVGILQHKIRIENPMNTAPQISGDYKKGYDKLTNGIGISEFIGYQYMGNRRLISFFGGFEFTQAFTQSRRSYDFNLQRYDSKRRVDLLWGFKVGWIIPFYKKTPAGYYYN